MTIRKTTKWLFFLVLLVAACVSGYGFHVWNKCNEQIRKTILAKCAELVPEWDVSLGRVRFDWNRRVHLYDFKLKARGQSQQIVTIPETIISIDREKFTSNQQVDVQKVRILGPVLDLIRDADGKWNWQELQAPPSSKQSLPELEIIQAMVRVRLDQSDGSQAARLSLQNADLKLIPSGKRRFIVKGLTQVSQAGKLAVEGSWDLDQRVGWFDGQMKDVASSGELSGLVIGNSPELRLKLARFETAVERYVHSLETGGAVHDQNPFLVASRRTEGPSPAKIPAEVTKTDGVPNLGASGNLDVQFRVAIKEPKSEPEFSLRVDVKHGRIDNDVLPFPLRDLTGKILWDNKRLVLTGMTAKNGMTRLSLDGQFDRQGKTAPGRLDVSIQNLSLDERLRKRLPLEVRKPYDSVNPRGIADLNGTLYFDGIRTWRPQDVEIDIRNGAGRHDKFPYPVEEVAGKIKQRPGGEIFDVVLTGQAGGRPAMINGHVINPGPTAESYFAIHVDRLPVDDTFVAACNPAMKKTLAALNLEGNIAADMTMHRPAGANQKFAIQISARVTDAAMEFVHFPYRLKGLQGDVEFSSREGTWQFNNLSARHGNAQISASGRFVKREAPGLLRLTLVAKHADIDRQLEQALNPTLQKAWKQLSPAGQLDLTSEISWVPGQPAAISLTDAAVTNGELTFSAFPYPLENVNMRFSYANSKVELKSLTGTHDNTKVRSANGHVVWNRQGDWGVRLDELIVDDLIPDRLFRRALPADLRTVVEEIDPVGPISLDGMVEFLGTNRPETLVTAAWDIQTVHSGGKLTAGIDLEKVYGRLSTRGTWDGRQVDMSGKIEFDSVEIKGYQLTSVQGPYRIKNNKVTVGSAEIINPKSNPGNRGPVASDERVIARAIGGVFTFDAEVDLSKDSQYHAKLTMSQGRLEQYARRYMTGAKNLAGVMDGWVDIEGRGGAKEKIKGTGQLRINPAALYELPVIVQIVNLVGRPDKTAFRYALLDFDIANSQFLFNRIDLVGDALSLRGRGTARFDGRLNLDFFSMLPRSRLRIPIVSAVVGEATKGWVRVRVRGTTSVPDTKVLAAPQLDEALKGFLGAFGTGQPTSIPRLLFTPLGVPLRGTQAFPRRTNR